MYSQIPYVVWSCYIEGDGYYHNTDEDESSLQGSSHL